MNVPFFPAFFPAMQQIGEKTPVRTFQNLKAQVQSHAINH